MKGIFSVFLLVFTNFFVHDNHGTLMVFEYDQDLKSFDNIYIEVDAFHFEEALNNFGDGIESLENVVEENEAFIQAYIDETMALNVNGKDQVLKIKSIEVDYLYCIINFELEDKFRKIKKLEMTNKFMFELFPNQKNLVNFFIKGAQISFLFDSKNTKEFSKL